MDYNIEELLERNHKQYDFKYFGSGTVPGTGAGGSITIPVAISADAHFRCMSFTGSFTTLGAGGADDGVNHLSCRLEDTGRSLRLFDDFIPLSLFMSPGRSRAAGIAGDASNQLFFPIDFDYTFLANSTIELNLQNDSVTANTFQWCFHGTKYRVDFDAESQPQV